MSVVALIVRPTITHGAEADVLNIMLDLPDLERRIKELKRSQPDCKIEIVLRPSPPPKEILTLFNIPTYFR